MGITLKMTECGVFKILFKHEIDAECNLDFPKQQTDAVYTISTKLTDAIYESYENESSDSTNRIKTLKFINKICQVRGRHSIEDYMKCSLKEIHKSFDMMEDEDVINVNKNIASDMNKYKDNLFYKNIDEYYSRKIKKEKEIATKRELIDQDIQEKLGKKYHMQLRKKYSFGTNENRLKKILETESDLKVSSNIRKDNEEDACARKNIVKLGYSMLNLQQNDILQRIIKRISYVNTPNRLETNFLRYIWLQLDSEDVYILIENNLDIFYFIIEQTLLKHATHLIGLKEEVEISQYFLELKNERCILRIKKICKSDLYCYLELKTLLYELYCMSFCNLNILKLCEFIK